LNSALAMQYSTHENSQIDYDQHPVFRSLADPIHIPNEMLLSFDVAYAELSAKLKLRQQSLDGAVRYLQPLAEEVFGEIQRQTRDDHERLFIGNLKRCVLRLMREHLEVLAAGTWLPEDSESPALARELRDRKFFFGKLNPATVAQIKCVSGAQLDEFRERARQGRLSREELSVNQGAVTTSIVALLNDDFGAQGVLDIVSKYMGRRYRVGGVALELSPRGATWWCDIFGQTIASRTPYVHIDQSGMFPKSIVYLSDVEPMNGPTMCYPGVYERLKLNTLQELTGRVIAEVWKDSPKLKDYYEIQPSREIMSHEKFRRHFMRLPESLRFNGHFGWDVIPGSACESSLLAARMGMLGPRGTFIVFDGARLLHSGGMVQEGERIALQVIFQPVLSLVTRAWRKWKRINSGGNL
jgi:hypothetical protein